jgi:hypothetical protein
MRILRGILVIFMLLGVTGGPWPVMQAVAWTTMLAGNLRTGSFSQAVAQTFDGQHPCNLCKAIAAGKKSEGKSELAPAMTRLEFLPRSRSFALVESDCVPLPADAGRIVRSITLQPPTPPPRAICA